MGTSAQDKVWFFKRARLSSEVWFDPCWGAVTVTRKYQGQMQTIRNYKASCCVVSLHFWNQLGKIYFCQEASLQALQQISIPICLKLCRVIISSFLLLMVPEMNSLHIGGSLTWSMSHFPSRLKRMGICLCPLKQCWAHIFPLKCKKMCVYSCPLHHSWA